MHLPLMHPPLGRNTSGSKKTSEVTEGRVPYTQAAGGHGALIKHIILCRIRRLKRNPTLIRDRGLHRGGLPSGATPPYKVVLQTHHIFDTLHLRGIRIESTGELVAPEAYAPQPSKMMPHKLDGSHMRVPTTSQLRLCTATSVGSTACVQMCMGRARSVCSPVFVQLCLPPCLLPSLCAAVLMQIPCLHTDYSSVCACVYACAGACAHTSEYLNT